MAGIAAPMADVRATSTACSVWDFTTCHTPIIHLEFLTMAQRHARAALSTTCAISLDNAGWHAIECDSRMSEYGALHDLAKIKVNGGRSDTALIVELPAEC